MAFFKEKTNCIECNKRLGFQRSYKNHCSTSCKRKTNGQEKHPLRGFDNCNVCGTKYAKIHINMKYCSNECYDVMSKSRSNELRSEFSIFERDDFKCIYCGKSSIDDGIKLHIEHINPLKLGGSSNIKNLITACQKCNNSKGFKNLSNDVKIRIYNIISSRNSSLSILQLMQINSEIEKLSINDANRTKRHVK